MSSVHLRWFSSRCTWIISALAIGCGVLAAIPSDLRAEDLRETTSLKYVPEDASFFTTLLRNREQVEIFLASNAYAKLRKLPLLTFGLSMLEGQWNEPTNDELRTVKEWWEQEKNQKLSQVVLDAVSQEVFVYGDAKFADLLRLFQEFQRVARAAQIRAARDGDDDENTEQELLQALTASLAKFKIPGLVVGFRLTDTQTAIDQLARLEKELRELLSQQEALRPLHDRLTRETIGDASFLTWPLDSSLIPWDQLPDDSPLKANEAIRAASSQLKVTISLGVKDGYLLLAVGESTEPLRRMGEGRLLIDRSELAAVRQHAEKRLVNVGYASRELMEQANSAASQFDDLVSTAETMLPLAELGEETTENLLKDLREFVAELKVYIPKPGAVVGFTFLTDRGFEGFRYNWGENKTLDGSLPLDILDHVGSNPIAFTAARAKYAPETYDLAVKWLRRAWRRAEQIYEPKLDDEERERFEKIRKQAIPFLERLDKATRDDLIPSLKDGQVALVVDVKASSKQWHRDLPSTRVALPMFEFATVCGVSDPIATKRALAEYLAVFQEALLVAHELAEDAIPKIELPPPARQDAGVGDIYSYPIPEPVGLDPQFAPNIGLSKETLVVSLFPEQTKRLLAASPVKQVGPLAKKDRPLAAASYCNVAGLMDAMTPWVNYAVRLAGQAGGEENPEARVAAQMVAGNVTPILELLKCCGEYASVTYIENDAVVLHSATILIDAN